MSKAWEIQCADQSIGIANGYINSYTICPLGHDMPTTVANLQHAINLLEERSDEKRAYMILRHVPDKSLRNILLDGMGLRPFLARESERQNRTSIPQLERKHPELLPGSKAQWANETVTILRETEPDCYEFEYTGGTHACHYDFLTPL